MVKSRAAPDIQDRFDRLALVLKTQPWMEGTEQKFMAKFDLLLEEWERLYPGQLPPLLRFNADTDYEIVWPKGAKGRI